LNSYQICESCQKLQAINSYILRRICCTCLHYHLCNKRKSYFVVVIIIGNVTLLSYYVTKARMWGSCTVIGRRNMVSHVYNIICILIFQKELQKLWCAYNYIVLPITLNYPCVSNFLILLSTRIHSCFHILQLSHFTN